MRHVLPGVLVLALAPGACAGSNYEEVRAAAARRMQEKREQAQTTPQTAPQAAAPPASQAFAAVPVVPRAEEVPGGTVRVAKGETLYALSRRLGVEVGDLVRVNALEPPYAIRAGQTLAVPAARYHRVGPGETAYAISRAYGADLTLLVRINAIEPPYAVKLGQRLRLPPEMTLEDRAAAFSVDIPSGQPAAATPPLPSTPAAPVPQPSLPPPPAFAGSFVWPVSGRVVSRFGPKEGGLFNDGVNIAAPHGAPVRSAADGVVAYVGDRLEAFGNLLLVKHADGWVTAYAHCSAILVKRGDKVSAGEVVAKVGRTGVVSSPQLHFEIRQGRKAIDPLGRLPRVAANG